MYPTGEAVAGLERMAVEEFGGVETAAAFTLDDLDVDRVLTTAHQNALFASAENFTGARRA